MGAQLAAAAEAEAGAAVHRAEAQHVRGEPRLDRRGGLQHDQGRGIAAAGNIDRVARRRQAELGRDRDRRRGVAEIEADDAVDIVERHPGVARGAEAGFRRDVEHGAAGLLGERRVADPGDAVLVAQLPHG